MNDKNAMKSSKPETLQERSARLEAEASRLASGEFPPEDAASSNAEEQTPGISNEEFEALKAELAQTKDQALRALAEAENARKRAVREREDAAKFAIASFARDLLEVANNLRRALDAVPADIADERVKNLVEGIAATERELLKSFEKNGIRKINPLDEPFNPNFHEVMFEVPGSGKPAGTIVQVIDVGYVLNDRLLRPARVGVAKDEGQGQNGPGGHIDTQA